MFAACLALGLAACGPGPLGPTDSGRQEAPPPADGGTDAGTSATAPPPLEVGTGLSGFEPVSDGQSLEVIFGPQGGYHVWAAIRASKKDVTPDRAQVRVKLIKDGTVLSENPYQLNLVDSGGFYEWYALQALVPDPAVVDGQTVTVRIELSDRIGRSAADEVTIVADWRN
jgi:hypothetical protein